ncbi:uncharacterized protein PRCAT00002783001 [Priceomyces carsonii]|uniref:uncharacterized protein n=1 Tax=Priceomyces carsonii TaxID=28549 RepID=UPI002ED9E52A|nr:unnamed protein product [Priceomyces carsonii]
MSSFTSNRDLVHKIIPTLTLSDLSTGLNDIENDIDYLLSWLSPYYPIPEWSQKEPSSRIKAAIRSCLKDLNGELTFIKLYINSVNNSFMLHFKTEGLDLFQIFNQIRRILNYYEWHLNYLNLDSLPRDIFQRNLHTLFYNALIKESQLLDHLRSYLKINLFDSSSPKNDKLSDALAILISINFTDELNFIIVQLSIAKIKEYVLRVCSDVLNEPFLEKIKGFVENEIWPSFHIIMTLSNNDQIFLYDLIKIACDELVSLRISEIYKMVHDYPQSKISLFELYQCLNYSIPQTNIKTRFSTLMNYSTYSQAYQRTTLVETFIQRCNENLLHSGTNTVDVITTYTKTIRAFLIIDPKGVLLDKVIRPIRRYLKTRDDIIIKLVHGLLDDSDTNELRDLAVELRRQDSELFSKRIVIDENIDLHWTPDPIDALPDFKKGKLTDIIESLISIFDSKDIFINEFTKLFSERLIKQFDYNVDEIVDYLLLLKLRFGKNEFTTLDVMIRDIKESRLINDLLYSRSSSPQSNFQSTILSHNYWNHLMESISAQNDNFKLPESIYQDFKNFSDSYLELKKGRYLKLLPHLGLVKIELSLNNKTLNFETSPDRASIITLFNDKSDPLLLDFVVQELKMTPFIASQALQFWVKQEVLLEVTRDLYIVNEDADTEPMLELTSPSEKDILSADLKHLSIKSHESLQGLFPYIHGILNNLGPVTFDRIKDLLKVTVPKEVMNMEAVTNISLEEYLDGLVDDQKINFSNSCYSLKT